MTKIKVISVGKNKSIYDKLMENYIKLIKWKLEFVSIKIKKKLFDNDLKVLEAKMIVEEISASQNRIFALDPKGELISSEEFALKLRKTLDEGMNISFVIGGYLGLEKTILDKSDYVISLSKMIFNHDIAKLLLLEQIYRAQAIIYNHPYHR